MATAPSVPMSLPPAIAGFIAASTTNGAPSPGVGFKGGKCVSDPSDEDLLARVAVGDGDAFETLMGRHLAAIGGYVRRMLGPVAADDVTQECFLRIWRSAAGRGSGCRPPVRGACSADRAGGRGRGAPPA
ncbi:MAG: sigma factor [Thalassobaculaceae bacterium]